MEAVAKINLSGSTQITVEGIKKHFQSYEPFQCLIECIWNGYDANANHLSVRINKNGLDGLESVLIVDDGDGVDAHDLSNSFGKFNESQKKLDDNKHGSQGKGRLSFHRLCDQATWFTKNANLNARIDISSRSIKDYNCIEIDSKEQHVSLKGFPSGTCVELSEFSSNELPSEQSLLNIFSDEFGWFLALYPHVSLEINKNFVQIPECQIRETEFDIDGYTFKVKVIRWIKKPSSEKSYNYLISSRSRIVKKDLSRFNNKLGFYASAYIYSTWIDEYDPDLMPIDPVAEKNQKIYSKLMKQLQDFQRDVYKDYLREFVDLEIEKFDNNGCFPTYQGVDLALAKWRKENTKSILREIYMAEPTVFNNLKDKQAKIIIRLLDKLLVSNENDSLFEVLEGVLDLGDEHINLLATQIKKTTLENIIGTIEILQKRQFAVHNLKEVIGNRYSEVLETPDLQQIIESNTWLFGPQYTIIGAEEVSFTAIAKKLRSEIQGIDAINSEEIFGDVDIEGARRQVDLFLARKIPTTDYDGKQIFKCLIVEIKRPSISLNKRHLRQLDDYAEIISKHTGFTSDKLRFELVLIGRRISDDDTQIRDRLNNMKSENEYGLVTKNGKIKCYVKDWFTIFDEFELSNLYLLDNLKTRLGELSEVQTGVMVEDLQKVRA